MRTALSSSVLATIIAFTGCTAAFIVPQEAAAFQRRVARASVSHVAVSHVTRTAFHPAPAFRPAVQRRPTTFARQTTFARPATSFARPTFAAVHPAPFGASGSRVSFASGLQHSKTLNGGGFPRPNSLGAPFSHVSAVSSLPHPGTLTSSLSHPGSFTGSFPHPGSLTSSLSHPSTLNSSLLRTGSLPRPGSLGGNSAPAKSLAGNLPRAGNLGQASSPATHGNARSLLGDLGNIGSSIVKEGVDVAGDIITGQAQKIPGTVLKDGVKVATGVIKVGGDVFAPPPPRLPPNAPSSKSPSSTTSNASGLKLGTLTSIQNAIDPFKKAPVFVPHTTGIQSANASPSATTASATQPTVKCIVAPCPTHLPTGNLNLPTGTAQQVPPKHPGTNGIPVGQGPTGGGQGASGNGSASNGSASNGSASNGSASNGSASNGSGSNGSASNGSGSGGSAGGGSASAGSSPAAGGSASAPSAASTTSSPTAPDASPVAAGAASPAPSELASQPAVNDPQPTSQPAATTTPVATPTATQASPEFVLVKFQGGLSGADLATFLQAYQVSIAEAPTTDGVYKLRLDATVPSDQLQQVIDSMKSQTAMVVDAAAA